MYQLSVLYSKSWGQWVSYKRLWCMFLAHTAPAGVVFSRSSSGGAWNSELTPVGSRSEEKHKCLENTFTGWENVQVHRTRRWHGLRPFQRWTPQARWTCCPLATLTSHICPGVIIPVSSRVMKTWWGSIYQSEGLFKKVLPLNNSWTSKVFLIEPHE